MSASPVACAAGTASSPAPVAPGERLLLVDALRGLALLGILAVNMHFFAHPFAAAMYTPSPADPHTPLDHVAAWLIRCLCEGKFYALFSLLFGLGFTIQAARAHDVDTFVARYCRRLMVLLLFGAAHVTLLWVGDILAYYAVVGFLLIPFLKARPRVLAFSAGGAGISLLVVWALLTWLSYLEPATAEPARTATSIAAATAPSPVDEDAWLRDWAEHAYQVYGRGQFGDQVKHRLMDYGWALFFLIYMAPSILGYFLLGAAIGRVGWLHDPAAHRRALHRMARWGLGLGLPANVAIASLTGHADVDFTWPGLALIAADVAANAALCLGYVGVVSLLWLTPAWQWRLRPLASAGRMALSNYLLQSLICTTLVYSYGLGWYGRVSYAGGLMLTLAIYALQVPLSVVWLRVFRFGPAEWLWRTLTYGRIQPLLARRAP